MLTFQLSFCLGIISNAFDAAESRVKIENVYDFLLDYNVIKNHIKHPQVFNG